MSNYLDEGEKIQKIKKLMSTDKYDAGIAKYIIVTCVSGNVEHIDTKEQAAHIF